MTPEAELLRNFTRMVTQVHISFRQAIQHRLKEHGMDLTFEMLQIILCVWNKEGINQQDLANQTFKDKASLTGLINNLEKRNLVIRKGDPIDRRNKLIYLTSEAKELCSTTLPTIYDIYSTVSQKMDIKRVQPSFDFLLELDALFKEA